VVGVVCLEVLAKPGASVESGRDSHRDPPQVVVVELLLEVDAVAVLAGGPSLSSPVSYTTPWDSTSATKPPTSGTGPVISETGLPTNGT